MYDQWHKMYHFIRNIYSEKTPYSSALFHAHMDHIWWEQDSEKWDCFGEFGSYRIWVRHMRNVRAVFPFAPHVLCHDSFHLCYVSVSLIGSKEAKLNSHLHFSFLTTYIYRWIQSVQSLIIAQREFLTLSLSLSLSLSLYIYIITKENISKRYHFWKLTR